MTIAVWIIAIVEVIRIIQNTLQLKMLAEEKHRIKAYQDDALETYKASVDMSDKEFINAIEEAKKQWQPQTERPCDDCIDFNCMGYGCDKTDCGWGEPK